MWRSGNHGHPLDLDECQGVLRLILDGCPGFPGLPPTPGRARVPRADFCKLSMRLDQTFPKQRARRARSQENGVSVEFFWKNKKSLTLIFERKYR
jgi:hypothetical protein